MNFCYKLFFTLLFSSVYFYSVGQTLQFAKTLEEAQLKAQNSNQLVLIIVNPNDCKDCKKVDILKKLKGKALINLFENYIVYFISEMEGEGQKVLSQYKIQPRLPAYIFINKNNELVHTESGFSSDDSFYARIHDRVQDLTRLKGAKGYVYYNQNYSKNRLDQVFLREYIEFFSGLNRIIPDSILMDFINSLNTEQLDQLETRAYILTKGVVLDGEVYKRLLGSKKNFSDIYNSLPTQERGVINSKMIQKTIQEAIIKKDTSLALNGARFAERTWVSDKRRGYLSYLYNMKNFYSGVRDTSKFLIKSGEIADLYLTKDIQDTTLNTGIKQLRGQELNNIAFSVFQWTKKQEWISRALKWSELSLTTAEQAEFLDTLAHLQYRSGQKTAAFENQSKAISCAKKEGKSIGRYELELNKMKADTL